MKHLTWLSLIPLLASFPASAETTRLAADDWYKNHYAILYKESPWDNAEQLGAMFDENLHHHQSDGMVAMANGPQWITEAIAGWKADGWLGSQLAGYDYDLLNATTAVFKAKWRDHYADNSIVFECGWYLADLKSDGWIITQYADIDCAAHGL